MATVKSSQRAGQPVCRFRLGRYDPTRLDPCWSRLGWQALGASEYEGKHSLRLVPKHMAWGVEIAAQEVE